jgi:hypothetical protein
MNILKMQLQVEKHIDISTSCLRLPHKKKWLEMTKAGIKTEDYRELTPYWYSIICLYEGQKKSRRYWQFAPFNFFGFDTSKISFKKYDVNFMTLGYPKNGDTERTLKLEHKGIEIRTGNPDWGAEPNKLYFVIMHGEVLG